MARQSPNTILAIGTSLVIAVIVAGAGEQQALAQACCAGGALVAPTRLAPYEDYAVGLQMRARSNPGSFGSDGSFRWSTGTEQVLEQDAVASLRVHRAAQVGVVLPLLQSHRRQSGLDEWGGGLGDVSLSARYDVLLASQMIHAPGVAVLLGATFPTGTPVDEATNPLGTDATGAGTYDATAGVGLEKVTGHLYLGLDVWATHRFSRTVSRAGSPTVSQDFSLRWTVLAAAAYVFDSEAGLALYGNFVDEGASKVNGVVAPASAVRLTTVGAAAALPVGTAWKLHAALFSDVMLSSFGRNDPAGFGLTASVVHVWM